MARPPTTKRAVDDDGKITIRGKVGNGEGTVYWHLKEEAWRASYQLDGKRRWVQASTREKVIARRAAAIEKGLRARYGGMQFTAKTTVAAFAAWWLDTEVRHNVRGSSVDEYRKRLGRLGSLATAPIVSVRREDLISWQSDLLDRMAARTVASTRLTVREMFKRAAQLGAIPFSPAVDMRPPKIDRRQHGRVLTPAEVGKLLRALDGYRYAPVVHIMYTTGLRVSEVLGLTWDDLDFDAGTARVRFAATFSRREGLHLGPPKTEGAEGQHHLAPGALALLKRWKRDQATERLAAPDWPEHLDSDGAPVSPVFTTPSGNLVNRQHIDKLARHAATKAGIGSAGMGTHTGRRTVINTLDRAGATVEDIGAHVGHKNTNTTRGYLKTNTERPKATANLAASLLDIADG